MPGLGEEEGQKVPETTGWIYLLPRNRARKNGEMVHFTFCMFHHGKNTHLICLNPDVQGDSEFETKPENWRVGNRRGKWVRV